MKVIAVDEPSMNFTTEAFLLLSRSFASHQIKVIIISLKSNRNYARYKRYCDKFGINIAGIWLQISNT